MTGKECGKKMHEKKTRTGKMCGKNSGGFTLLETVLVISVSAVTGVLLAGFLAGQIRFYNVFEEKSQAESMCAQAYARLEEYLRFGCEFYADPDRTDELVYSVREKDGKKTFRIGAFDLNVDRMGNLELKLDFSGTDTETVRVRILVMSGEREAFRRDAVIRSFYGKDKGD